MFAEKRFDMISFTDVLPFGAKELPCWQLFLKPVSSAQ